MIVCVCHRISDRQIAQHARAGFDFNSIQLELGVATGCGKCETCARDLVAQCHSGPISGQIAHIHREGEAPLRDGWIARNSPVDAA